MDICIDYLQFFSKKESKDVKNNELGFILSDYSNVKSGYGYSKCQYNNNVRVYFSDGENNQDGTFVQISGKGCRYIENLELFNWKKFLCDVTTKENKVNRIDLAIDLYDKELNISTMDRFLQDGKCVTKLKTYFRKNPKYIGSNKYKENTLYIGSMNSDFFIRVYDKKLEQEGKGYEVDKNSWVRFEMVLKNDNAQNCALLLSMSMKFDIIVNGILNNYIRFIDIKDNSIKYRCKNIEWWDNFIMKVNKISISSGKGTKTLASVDKYIRNQASTSLKTLYLAYGEDYIMKIIRDAKLSDENIKLLEEYKNIKKIK